MKRSLLSLILLFAILGNVYSQDGAEDRWSVEGKIINATNQEPVLAKIVYESLPYGSNIGFLKGENFSFYIPREKEYRIKVEAEGFAPYTHDIGLHEFQEGHFYTVVELMPNGAGQLIRLKKLIFGLGKAVITEESYNELNQLVDMMNKNPDMVIQLEGHTDYRGDAKLNMELSEDRVDAVRDYLTSKGIEKRRIKTKAFGGTQPLSTDSGSRDMNRRVEVRIISN